MGLSMKVHERQAHKHGTLPPNEHLIDARIGDLVRARGTVRGITPIANTTSTLGYSATRLIVSGPDVRLGTTFDQLGGWQVDGGTTFNVSWLDGDEMIFVTWQSFRGESIDPFVASMQAHAQRYIEQIPKAERNDFAGRLKAAYAAAQPR
jgi:hypothetical protein